jgi:hypothetical protein
VTNLSHIFSKAVDRQIEGVIKADDEASLRLEIEEYVLTDEIKKRLDGFLQAYNNNGAANGVWISGFFGSGKSHLLKMLALLLENRQINGTSALERFLPKCGDDPFLQADLRRAVAIPSKSILFNIDQKADVISKTQIDALLAVFVKVFDEMCGYYGKQGHIAQFERELDARGLYEQFKSAYQSVAGKTWQKGREQALLEAKSIARAYAMTLGGDESAATGILDKYRSQYRVSIEDFADMVHSYIEQQTARPGNQGFRLNFFVDEVGQYIAENVKLMTNLQTIAESLATRCRGRAWIIVTSQNDMTTVIGEMNKQQSNDFSKIMARFNSKMLLTSTDVAEVIQKRLLDKTPEAKIQVRELYRQHSNNFGTLFGFSDGSREYKVYRDEDEFVLSYPFVPYQFELFQSAIENLSRHNAFEGKHSSVGERSMLAVFQQVAIGLGAQELGQLATFDLMFAGIQTTLKSQTQQAVLAAERQLPNRFAVQLLKALFLVKYVREFKPTLRNLWILMIDHFNQDLPSLRKRVEDALNLLEQQTFIQRNGDLYEYLTDEEKDVEQEIKNTEVDAEDVVAELEKIVFDHIIRQRKIRHEENGQDYPFSRKLDDRLFGREYELAIHIVTPFNENVGNETVLRMQSMGRDELLIILPPDDRLVRDLLLYKRTEKYVRQNISSTQHEGVKRILTDKAAQNGDRLVEMQKLVQNLISRAGLFVAGAPIEIGAEDPQTRIQRGFRELIARAYPNLRMLRGTIYTENDIATSLKVLQPELFTTLPEAEQELLAFIQSNNRIGVRTTLKSLLEKFERKPYGWYYAAILCTLAKLCGLGKIEVRADGNLLEAEALERAFRNTSAHGNIILEPQVEFTASQVRALKQFFEDFFDAPARSSEAKALGMETSAALQELAHQLTTLAAQASQYPFLNALTPVLENLKEMTGKPYSWYLTEQSRLEGTMLDAKERVIDPVRKFMSGPQRDIFDNVRTFVQTQEPNFSYIDGQEAAQIVAILTDPECFKGNRMQLVKTQLETLHDNVTTRVEAEITKAKETIDSLKNRLCGMAEFGALNGDQQQQIVHPFDEFSAAIERQKLIAVIRDTRRRFEENDYQRLLSQMTSWAQPAPTSEPLPESGVASARDSGPKPTPSGKMEPRIEYIPSRSVKVLFEKAWLADEADVERYLESMREALLDEIRKGRRIQI